MAETINKDTIGHYLKKNYSENKQILKPYEFILENNGNISKEYVLNFLQNHVRSLLFYYLNDNCWNIKKVEKRSLLSCFHNTSERLLYNAFLQLEQILRISNKRFGFFPELYSCINKLKRNLSAREQDIIKLFGLFYKEFGDIVSGMFNGHRKVMQKKPCPAIAVNDYPEMYSGPLNQLKALAENKLKKYLSGFYLHGSLSTMDYIKYWSDIDTLMIVNKNTIGDYKQLIELKHIITQTRKLLFFVDPFQLHGHFVVTEYDLDYYPQSFFPLTLFDYSKSFLFHDRQLLFALRDYSNERLAEFWFGAVNYFLSKGLTYQKNRSTKTGRKIKLFLHRLMSYPLFYLQSKGEHQYKKYSFEIAKKDFPPQLWEPVETATDLMRKWDFQYSFRQWKTFDIFGLQLKRYWHERFAFEKSGINRQFHRMYEELLEKSIKLSIYGWDKVLNG